MKKQEKILFFVAVAGVLIALFLNKKRKPVSGEKRLFTEEDAIEALKKAQIEFGTEKAKILEKILRWETAHFKSKQFQFTGSAGMEIGKWKNLPPNAPYITLTENKTGLKKKFIVWGSVYNFLKYLSEYIDRHEGNWGRWYSINPEKQADYKAKVNQVKNRIVK